MAQREGWGWGWNAIGSPTRRPSMLDDAGVYVRHSTSGGDRVEPQAEQRQSSPRDGFWAGVIAAEDVLKCPLLEREWSTPSVLPELTTGEVAAHLVRAVGTVVTYASAAAPPIEARGISAAEYFVALISAPSDLASSVNEGVRRRSREDAEPGCAALLKRWDEAAAAAQEVLGGLTDDRLLAVAGGLVLTVEEYLRTRIVELVVHTEDLALSLGLEPPGPPPEVAGVAAHTLLEVARIRHGDVRVLRAMCRRERESCEVFQVF